MRCVCYIVVFLFVHSHCQVFAQDPVYRSITNLNGLPSNTVYNVLQDKKGFVWIAHDRGLCRYDGKTFKPYINQSQNSRSISNLMEDAKGNIWCQDFIGNFFSTLNDSLQVEKAMFTNGGFKSAKIIGGNTVVSNADSGILTFNINTREAKKIAIDDDILPSITLYNDTAYFLGRKHLYQYDGRVVRMLQHVGAFSEAVKYLIKSRNNFYTIQRSEMPYVQYFNSNKYVQTLLPAGLFIQNVTYVGSNEIWLATSRGAYCFDLDFKPLYNGHCFFKEFSISDVIKDADNNYWFTTIGNGLMLVPEINVRLYANVGSMNVLAATNNAKELLVGTTKNELLQFNTGTTNFKKLFNGGVIHEAISIYQADADKIVYSGDKTYFLKQQVPASIRQLSVKSAVSIHSNLIVVAYTSGICLLSFDGKKPNIPDWLSPYILNTQLRQEGRVDLINGTRGRWVAYNALDSTLYAATTNGLLYWSPGGKGSIKYGNKEIFATQIKIVNGKLYVSSFEDGLFVINKTNIEKNIGSKQGLENTTIYKFQKAGSKIWMISDGLLQVYDENAGTLEKYDYTDGLPRAELKDLQIQDGQVYLATTDGLVTFEAAMPHLNYTRPRIEINSIRLKVNGRMVYDTTKLSYSENAIVIDFSVLAFKADKNIKVEYRINTGPWQLLEKNARELNLPSLAPGTYKIALRSFNEDGFASQNDVECNFTIQAPFYQRIWFLIPMLLLGGLVAFILVQHRINRIRKTNNLKAQKLELEQHLQKSMLSSIKAQMNPHFIFNALNTIQSFIFSNNKNEANAYLGKFSHLMRTVLEMSNKESVTLEEEIKALELYLELEKMRFEDKLEFVLSKAPDVNALLIRIPSMIIQPYVENAIKHGLLHKKDDRQLTIRFAMEGAKMLQVTVDDNGIGRKKSEEINARRKERFTSFSTQANETRLQLLNMDRKEKIGITYVDKEDVNHYATGTTVTLRIPI